MGDGADGVDPAGGVVELGRSIDLVRPADLVPAAVALARRWAAAGPTGAAARPGGVAGAPAGRWRTPGGAGARLARLVADPAGLELAVRFVDRVARPEDRGVAAGELARLAAGSARSAAFLGTLDRALLRLGGRLAPVAPGLVVPLARRRLRRLVGHLVVDARPRALGRQLDRARRPGLRFNLNLLGEAVLGEAEAARRTGLVRGLLRRPDIDYVSVKVSSLVSQLNAWDTREGVARVRARLHPLLVDAARRSPPGFVTLDMEEYRDLDVTVESFTAALGDPALAHLEAGIAVQAYLPDALLAFERLLAFARDRRARGGARIKVRLVKGANLAMERVEAELHGWTPAPFSTKEQVDASYVRLLDVALRPDVTDAVRVGVASHNLYDVALAHLLAEARGVGEALDVEMLHGMAPEQARAVHEDVGSLVLYTPVVAPEDFDVAVSYLVRRLEEAAGGENFLHALVGTGARARAALAEQEARFVQSVADLGMVAAEPRRGDRWADGSRAGGRRPADSRPFRNVPDADPAGAATRNQALRALARRPTEAGSPLLRDPDAVDRVVARAVELSAGWASAGAGTRAAVLRTAADLLEARRAELWTVLAHEGGKPVIDADPEVSEAVDLAAYYADRSEELDGVDGARFVPARVTVVTPPWNFPVAIPIGGALAGLAAGSAVVLKPAPQTPVCAETAAAAVREALTAHGFPVDLLQVVRTDEGAVGRRLVSHPAVDAVLLTGSVETARLFASWRPDLRLLAETSGKNAIVVTPAADVDLAVADLVRSAFGHAGQKCSAASLAILVGSAATSGRLRRQLTEAIASVQVAWAQDPASGMGALVEPPRGKLLRALTRLEPGESWLVEPRALDSSGRLWSPGLKAGVRPGSFFHLTECFGPVLGLLAAPTLEEAVRLQNATAYGLTGGLHSLDDAEIEYWLDRVEVGNAYVNRPITGAVVRRQPFGGWKASGVGPGAKAGGPNYVAQIGAWVPAGDPCRLAGPSAAVLARLAALRPLVAGPGQEADLRALRTAAGSDQYAWAQELGREHDPSALASESNVLRYRPAPELWVRAGADARWVDVVRVLLAVARAGGAARASLHPALVGTLPETAQAAAALRGLDPAGRVETDAGFAELLRASGGPAGGPRVRVVGEAAGLWAAAAEVGATLLTGPVLGNGRREMLVAVREQTISRTLHRFGHLPPGGPAPPR